MNAYLFTAVSTLSQLRPNTGRYGSAETFQTWDGCSSLVVLNNNPDAAQKQFEAWLCTQPEGENPLTVQIKKIAAAQFVDQLLTESGNEPLGWLEIWKEWQSQAESLPIDEFEQGYWVDVESAIPSGRLAPDVQMFRQELPEDLRAGLNWSPDKQFFYVLSVLAPLTVPPEVTSESEDDGPDHAELLDKSAEESNAIGIGELYNMYPGSAGQGSRRV